MKKLILAILIPALGFLISCGGSDDGGIMSQMKKMKEVADNAKEMQKEEKQHPEDTKKIFTEHRLSEMDIPATGQKISDEVWERVQKTVDDFAAMDSATKANLNHEKVAEFYKAHGYANIDEAEKELKQIGSLNQTLIEWAMHFAGIKQVRLIDGKEAADKALEEFANKLKEAGYSKEDLKKIEQNVDIEAKALAMLFTLEAYKQIEAVSAAVDSVENVQE